MDSVRSIPAFATHAGFVRRRAARPTAREWARHTALFLATALTVTWAWLVLGVPAGEVPEPALAWPSTLLEYVLFVPTYYVQWMGALFAYALAHPAFIAEGATFAGALLSILLAHESGHYVACRLYGVNATLPFFIPVPPPFLLGTFGAFIAEGLLIFNDPPLLRLLAALTGLKDLPNIAPNPFHIAAWVGLLVTSLNLLPVGQLDGGHAVYAVFGKRVHRHTGRVAFISTLALAPLGWLWHGAPSGFVYAVLLFVMLRMRHPEVGDETEPLGRARLIVAALTLLVFLLSFTAFPLTIR
ncbi:MAG: site-2 protease family protein [Acidobacteria bacterium]|nr:site-2 protease family protein [Acidobacteriota bacterium]